MTKLILHSMLTHWNLNKNLKQKYIGLWFSLLKFHAHVWMGIVDGTHNLSIA